jgi:hypothetical protein
MRPEFYVKALMRGPKVRGYAVCQDVKKEDGKTAVTKQLHGFYDMKEVKGTPLALYLANKMRDDLNDGIA